jgi:hypothetical protein
MGFLLLTGSASLALQRALAVLTELICTRTGR